MSDGHIREHSVIHEVHLDVRAYIAVVRTARGSMRLGQPIRLQNCASKLTTELCRRVMSAPDSATHDSACQLLSQYAVVDLQPEQAASTTGTSMPSRSRAAHCH